MARLCTVEAPILAWQHVEGDGKTVHPLFEQRLDRLRRRVAARECVWTSAVVMSPLRRYYGNSRRANCALLNWSGADFVNNLGSKQGGGVATREFVQACKEERDALMALYADQSSTTAVRAHLDAAQLTPSQRIEVLAALNIALTDAFYTLLLGLAGAASLGSSQQMYRLADENACPISPAGDADLEASAYEIFQSGS